MLIGAAWSAIAASRPSRHARRGYIVRTKSRFVRHASLIKMVLHSPVRPGALVRNPREAP
jgi:hypothetical protein